MGSVENLMIVLSCLSMPGLHQTYILLNVMWCDVMWCDVMLQNTNDQSFSGQSMKRAITNPCIVEQSPT